jgi:hypothetical protein
MRADVEPDRAHVGDLGRRQAQDVGPVDASTRPHREVFSERDERRVGSRLHEELHVDGSVAVVAEVELERDEPREVDASCIELHVLLRNRIEPVAHRDSRARRAYFGDRELSGDGALDAHVVLAEVLDPLQRVSDVFPRVEDRRGLRADLTRASDGENHETGSTTESHGKPPLPADPKGLTAS